jgi:hypothetical protein
MGLLPLIHHNADKAMPYFKQKLWRVLKKKGLDSKEYITALNASLGK